MSAFASGGSIAIRPQYVPEKFRLIPRLETHPSVVSFAQTPGGKILLLILFGIGLSFATHMFYIPVLLALALITAFPAQRRVLVTLATLSFALATCWRKAAVTQAIDLVLVLLLAGLLFYAVAQFRQSFVGRRPLVTLFGGFLIAVLLVSFLHGGSVIQSRLWQFLILFGFYICAIAYSLLDSHSRNRDNFLYQLGTYRAFWGMTVTPTPKGSAYLRRVEAKTPQALAISQIKGLKLLAWSLVLFFIWKSLVRILHFNLGIPSYADVFALSAARSPYPCSVGWVALIAAFFEKILRLSYLGHQYIAICRMAGFMALRNTCRPMESRTIAEFWNRYYYYYKELLVDLFFYPTFMRYFKTRPRLRLFAATFVAVCIGNALLHFAAGYIEYVQEFGLRATLVKFQSYLIYSALLAVGIGISQLRNANAPRKDGWLRGRLIPAVCVIAFFCFLYIFDNDVGKYAPDAHFRYLANLFRWATW